MSAPALPGPAGRSAKWSGAGFIWFGLICVAILAGGFGTWAATARLAGAVVASGQLRVTAQQQVVQHPDGGIVAEIAAGEGDYVEGGQMLIMLDGDAKRSELNALEGQLFELLARRGRLLAEQADLDTITFDPELLEMAGTEPQIAQLVAGQRRLFEARRTTLARQMSVLEERKGQFREQIEGVKAELSSLDDQRALIEEELEGQLRLQAQGLARAERVLSLKREKSRLEGQAGQLRSRMAQLKGQISETEIEILRMKDQRIEEAVSRMREIGYRILDLREERIRLKQELDRLAIRAPRAGIVYDLKVHALKSVIRPAEPVLHIVPVDSGMVIEARVNPIDVDSVFLGQEASLRFSAFNSRTTPELFGSVVKKSPDAFTDEQTGQQFFRVEIEPRPGELEKLDGKELVAGMPVEAFIQTGDRTPLNYMIRPMSDYINRAWREQ